MDGTVRYQGWNFLHYLVFVAYSFWLPQIVHNALNNHSSPALSETYVVLVTLTRLTVPIYLWVYPANFISYVSAGTVARPHPSLCVALIGYVLAQVTSVVCRDGARDAGSQQQPALRRARQLAG